MTESQLLDRFVIDHDEAAFEALVRQHGPMVLGLCREILRDSHEADDVFQATFLALVRGAAKIRKRESLASWLYGVARRLSLKARMRAKRTALVEHGDSMQAVGPDNEFDRDELRPILHEEVGRLPEKYRSPIVLCYFEGRSHEEAARQLAWPIGTVKGRLARARETLHSRLTRRGVAPAIGLMALLESADVRADVPEALVRETVATARRGLRPRVVPSILACRTLLADRRAWLLALVLLAAFLFGWNARSQALAVWGVPPPDRNGGALDDRLAAERACLRDSR